MENVMSTIAAVSADSQPVLSVKGLSKSFNGRTVLKDVSLDVTRGQIVGLLGQNGCGKSTLIKVIAGYHEPDPGAEILINGEPFDVKSKSAGSLAFVHQNLGLFNQGTVLENLMANRWAREGGHIRWGKARAVARRLLQDFDLAVGLDTQVQELSAGEKAVLAIARAVGELEGSETGLLVLDEPTPYLARQEVAQLFIAMRSAAQRGNAILFVSHRLDEISEVTDRVVVLRDGSLVGHAETKTLDEDSLVELIVGRKITDYYPDSLPEPSGDPVVHVRNLDLGRGAKLDLKVRRSEVVGITGLLGSGFEDVPYALAGLRIAAIGEIGIGSKNLSIADLDPRTAIDNGLALVPADRARLGVAAQLTVRENMSLPWLPSLTKGVRIDQRQERSQVNTLLKDFDVRPRDSEALIGSLSGGNAQKTVLARWIAMSPQLLLLHEPTQGVDVGARQQIFSAIQEAVSEGMSVLYASLEYEDLAHMCDRVLVFRDGRVIAEVKGSELTEERLADLSLRTETT
jgi:ribose transport system ATP-binding protein